MPADHFDVELRAEDGARRFRIDPDVVFRRRRHIALAAGRAAHHHAAADPLRELRIALERKRDVGERPERHQGEAGLRLRETQDRVDRMLALGLALWRRIAAIAEAVFAMEPMRVVVRAVERLVRPGEDGHVGIADLGGQERVLGRLLEADIAGDRRQAEHPDVGLGERHDDRDGVVGGGVGVDEKVAHGFRVSRVGSSGARSAKKAGEQRPGDIGLARPITAELRNRVGDIGDAPVIEDVAIRRGQFGGSREILRRDEREGQTARKAQETDHRIAAFRASPSPHRGRRTMAAEFNCAIVRQGDRVGPEIRDVGERLAVRLLADRAMAEKAADRSPGDGKARSVAKAGAILVHCG